MPADRFSASVRLLDGVAVVDLSGEIDSGAEEALGVAYDQATSGANTVLLNFGGVEYINSTGIALIVGVLAKARKNGDSLTACGLADHYREIFEITRLSDFMQIFPDEASAVGDAVPETTGR
jgi:anti-sigma B factor antagonist